MRNAHPFRYGNIVGSHNGTCQAPDEYAVDSEYLFDLLYQKGGDYQAALAGVDGYWALTWFDGADFWLHCSGNRLSLAQHNGSWYYSSEAKHLRAALGNVKPLTLTDGGVWRFDLKCRGIDVYPPLLLAAPEPRLAGRDCWFDGALLHDEWADADRLAMDLGYGGLAEYMRANSIDVEGAAYENLLIEFEGLDVY